ncbi:MAG: YcgN family cysteine cluster protein, partial [Campylobacterales bacterium]|nr:YcgN family cysteine cluster protein [Campylobacterales bacterium]
LKKPGKLDEEEWEMLCDRCGLCCLHRVIMDDNTIATTCVVCKNYDLKNKKCADYENRFDTVSECIKLTPQKVAAYSWLPSTCAYRLIYQNLPLPHWHPLISRNPKSAWSFGVNEKDFIVENDNIDIEDFIVE